VVLKADRFHIIDELRKKHRHPLSWLLKLQRFQGMDTTSGATRRLEEDLLLKEHILVIYKLHPYYGYKRMTRCI
jgi:putative transposase